MGRAGPPRGVPVLTVGEGGVGDERLDQGEGGEQPADRVAGVVPHDDGARHHLDAGVGGVEDRLAERHHARASPSAATSSATVAATTAATR